MKIVVLVKHVPDSAADWRYREDLTLDRDGLAGHLSELDEYAVEQAVRLVELGAATSVTALTMGPAPAVDALRKTLAMGADEGVHITDEALRGSDALATSLVLATALRRTGFDLVLCGMSSTDAEMSVIPAMVAERLGVAQLTFADGLEVADGLVRIRREQDGVVQVVEAPPPAVVSVTDQTGEARYPSFKAIMAGKKKPLTSWSLVELGIPADQVGGAATATAVRAVLRQPPRSAGTVVVDEGDGAARIADYLAAQRLI